MVGAIQGGSAMSTEMIAQMRERMFSKLDTDGDGQIDLAELQAQATESGSTDNRFTDMFERLSEADTDGDGMVSITEFEAMKPPEPPPGGPAGRPEMSAESMAQMREKMFSELDSDGDGQIDLVELQAKVDDAAATDDHFSQLLADLKEADTDGDGMVSKTEFEAMKMPEPPRSRGSETRTEELPSAYLYAADGDTQVEQALTGLMLDTIG